MLLIRSVLFLVGQAVSSIFVCFLVVPALFVSSVKRAKIIGLWARFNIWTLRWICGVSYRVQGIDNLPDAPSIVIANHQSTWETLCFQLIFPAQSYILKKELFWIPFFGWGLAANRNIAIDRSQKRKALNLLIEHSKERLDEGRWLMIFPEGTRMPPGELGEFQVGGAMMASKTGAAVVPVAHNAGYCWPKNGIMKYPGVIDVIIGEPIDTEGMKPREINKIAEERVKALVATLPSPNAS